MKLKNNIVSGLLLLALTGCSLDYENTGAINPDNVWKDKTMIVAYLTDIYGGMRPGWPVNSNGTDEGMNGPKDMSQYVRGEITVDNTGQGLGYEYIDKINFFLQELEKVSPDVLSEEEKLQLRAEALFWRAWDYWGKVQNLGGVPLILEPQNVNDYESLFRERNSTSECIQQILQDLNEAIENLPDSWDDANYGRIDKGCAMAMKGRVLLWYASPLFNPNHEQDRWMAAYNANKEAVDFLRSVGKGLYQGKFEDIWYEERNVECIMVNQYYYSDHAFNQSNIRPEPFSGGSANQNQMILPLLMAFPKIDGSKLELDINRLQEDSEYNARFVDEFYTNRDPRMYATVFLPGTVYPSADEFIKGESFWDAWKKANDPETGVYYRTLIQDQLGKGIGAGVSSGFFQLKGFDKSLDQATLSRGETDWIEIRFAEVLMNMGEAANEIGKTDEALEVLYSIRKRAGIQSTDGKYGIIATSQDEIRQAYMDERFIEFAYEGKRWGDLRRWKRFDILNELKYRSGLYLVIKDEADVATMDWSQSMIEDADVRKKFRFDYIECLDGDKSYMFNLDLNHWFYPIAQNDLDRNSKLEQNNEWGGTFDPLK